MEKKLDEGMDLDHSNTEILTENPDSANIKYSNNDQTRNKYQDFVISSNQMPS